MESERACDRERSPGAFRARASVLAMLFSFGTPVFAAVPVEESVANSRNTPYETRMPPPDTDFREPESGADGRLTDLFYQLQLLQEEVQKLRGMVEEQEYRLERMSRQQNERYVELDRRLATSSSAGDSNPPAVVGRGSEAAVEGPGTERSAYTSAFALVQERRFDEAIAAFDRLIVDYPNGPYTPNAFYWLGELHLAKEDPEKARQSFVQIITLYPKHAKVPDALYKLGTVYHQLGDSARALEYLDRVIAEYPSGAAAGLAKSYASELR